MADYEDGVYIPKPPTVRASRRQEKRVAKEMGGRVVVASGALPGSGGDVKTADWLVECKTTRAAQYILTADTLDKIELEAARAGRRPALVIEMRGRQEVVVLQRNDFDALVRRAEE